MEDREKFYEAGYHLQLLISIKFKSPDWSYKHLYLPSHLTSLYCISIDKNLILLARPARTPGLSDPLSLSPEQLGLPLLCLALPTGPP